jgi:hypothetical protein
MRSYFFISDTNATDSMVTYIEARITWLTAVSTENGPFPFFSEHALLEVGWKVLLHNESALHNTLRSGVSACNISHSATRCDPLTSIPE